MLSFYRVAEHTFAVEAAEGFMEQFANYQPFAIDKEAADSPLFTLAIDGERCAELPVSSDWETVFVDREEPEMPRVEIYRDGSSWVLQTAVNQNAPSCLQLRMSEDFTQAQLTISTDEARFAVDNALMFLFAFNTVHHETLLLHASVTVLGEKAYLFLGKSGTGKSTHSRLWQEAFPKAWLLNDDNPAIRVKGDEVIVYGTPWSGKTPCYINRASRVGALVKLQQAPYNKIQRLRLPEAYGYLLASSSGLKIVPQMMDSLYGTMVRVLESVPIYGLECLPNTEAARVCAEAVTEL